MKNNLKNTILNSKDILLYSDIFNSQDSDDVIYLLRELHKNTTDLAILAKLRDKLDQMLDNYVETL